MSQFRTRMAPFLYTVPKTQKKKKLQKNCGTCSSSESLFRETLFFPCPTPFFQSFPNASHVCLIVGKKRLRGTSTQRVDSPVCWILIRNCLLVLFFGVFLITFFRHPSFSVKCSFFWFCVLLQLSQSVWFRTKHRLFCHRLSSSSSSSSTSPSPFHALVYAKEWRGSTVHKIKRKQKKTPSARQKKTPSSRRRSFFFSPLCVVHCRCRFRSGLRRFFFPGNFLPFYVARKFIFRHVLFAHLFCPPRV